MAILLVQLVTRSQRRSSAGISKTIALRKLGTRNCPCLNRFLSLKAPPLAAGIFYSILPAGDGSWSYSSIGCSSLTRLWRFVTRFLSPGWGIMTKKGLYNSLIEATFCQDKQALGFVTRRQRRWAAQQMVLLLARLAHHLLLWGKQWLRRVPTTRRRLQGYGLVRLLRDVWAVPGVIRWRRGWMVSVRFSPLHPLATPLQASFSALFRR